MTITVIPTIFWETHPKDMGAIPGEMLVFTETMALEDFINEVKLFRPGWVIPPWKLTDTGWSSRAAERAKVVCPTPASVGCVIVGKSDTERIDYFIWAQGQGFSPLILLPHVRRTRSRQVMDLNAQRYINPNTHIHLPGMELMGGFNPESFEGRYTTGVWF